MVRIYVGNLAGTTTDDQVLSLFQGLGRIRGYFVPRYQSGDCVGFALLELDLRGPHRYAWEQLDGVKLGGRRLRVRAALLQGGNRLPRLAEAAQAELRVQAY
jgi:RNA recognition motif-containing protein